MARTSGSAAACSRKAWTEVEKESYGWWSRTSRSRSAAKMSGADADSTSARSRWVPAMNFGYFSSGRSRLADAEEAGEVQGAGQRVHLGLGDLQLPYQQVEYVPVDGLLDLQAHRRSEAAPHEFLLQGLEEVLGVVLLDLQVLVPGDAERVVLQDLHAREQLLQVGRDDVLDGDVAARGGLQEAGEQRRDLDAREVAVAGDRVPHDDGEVQRQAGDVREGVRGVDRQRGQDREDLVAEEREEAGLLLLGQLAPADEVDALLGELGGHVLLVAGGVPGHELAGAGPDHLQHLAGLEARGGAGGHAGVRCGASGRPRGP